MSTEQPCAHGYYAAPPGHCLTCANEKLKAEVERLKQELCDMTKAYVQAGLKATLAQYTLDNWEADESLEKGDTEP